MLFIFVVSGEYDKKMYIPLATFAWLIGGPFTLIRLPSAVHFNSIIPILAHVVPIQHIITLETVVNKIINTHLLHNLWHEAIGRLY